jgi:hypothetical protein
MNLLGYLENNTCGYGLYVHRKLHMISIEGSWKIRLFQKWNIFKSFLQGLKVIKSLENMKKYFILVDTKKKMILK